jgi:oligopeptide transport system substrate-binding protein
MPTTGGCRLIGGRAHSRRPGGCLLGATLVLALLSAACSRAGGAAAQIGSGRFRVAIDRPASLDPALASQPQERLIASALFDGLVSYEATTAAVVPDAATSWQISAGDTVYTFHLRPRGRFSDGEPVTAESFVRGMTRALTPAIAGAPGALSGELAEVVGAPEVTAGVTTTLAGAVALDATTLQIRLAAPDAEFLLRLGEGPFDPIPSAAAMAARRPSWAADPLGNGAFELAPAPPGGWLGAAAITLVPNPMHDGSLPHVAQVVLKVIPTLSAAARAWMAGQVDWTPVVPTATAAVKALGKKSFIAGPVATVDYLAVEAAPALAAAPGLASLRAAIASSINRAALVAQAFKGAARPAQGFVPPIVPGSASAPGASATPPCQPCRVDPARARQLLAQSGISLGGPVPLYFAGGVGEDAWMDMVADDLRTTLGIDARPVAVPPGGAPGGPGPSGLALAGVSEQMAYPGAEAFLSSLLSPASGANLPAAAAQHLAAALAAARAVADPASRASAYRSAERQVMSSVPVIPLVWPEGVVLARLSAWSGLGMDPFGDPTLRTVARKG